MADNRMCMFCITCSAGGIQSEQPCWDAGPLWSGRVQLAGSVITTLQNDHCVIKELWAAVPLQTGLLDLSSCIFVRLGSMVGGLEGSALFSACKATRSAVRLLESTNLRVRGQVGIYNENFGACIDVLCALTGIEFVRVSHRWLVGGCSRWTSASYSLHNWMLCLPRRLNMKGLHGLWFWMGAISCFKSLMGLSG